MPIQLPGSPQTPTAQKRSGLSYQASFVPDNYSQANIRAPKTPGAEGALSTLGEGLGNAAETLEKRQDEEDKFAVAQARSHFMRRGIDAEAALLEEKDPDKIGALYSEAMNTARQEALAMVKNPRLAAVLDLDLGDEFERGKFQVFKLRKQKETDIGIAALNENMDRNTDTILSLPAGDPRAGKLLQEDLLAIDGALDRGYIDAVQAQQKKRERAIDIATRRIDMLPPEEQEKMLAPKETRSFYQMTMQAVGGDAQDAQTLQRIAYLESANDPMAVNPLSGASGLFQFMPATAKQYGLDDPTDPVKATKAGAQLYMDNKKTLTSALGRKPAPFEMYLAHQQGAGGAQVLIKNPEMNAIEALEKAGVSKEKAEASILNNGGTADMTAGDFVLKWAGKFGGVAPDDFPVPVFEKTGTLADVLPQDVRVLKYEKAKEAAAAQRKEALSQTKTSLVDSIQSILQETNGQIGAVPSSLKAQAVELGVWDTATTFSGRSDEDTLLNLKTMKSGEFRDVDLRAYRDRLSASDYETLVTKQAELDNPDSARVGTLADNAVDYFNAKTGRFNTNKKMQKQELSQFKELAESRFADEIRARGVPDFKRQQEILDDILLNSVLQKGFFVKNQDTLTLKISDIPETTRADIENSLLSQGIEPTAGNIIDRYQRLTQAQ